MDNKLIIKEIVNGIASFKIIPFIGAGMSKSCGAADWSEAISNLKNELQTPTDSFLMVAQEYEAKFGRSALISKLEALCRLEILDSTSLDLHLKILAMNPPIVYTTNYDEAIETAAKLLRRQYKKVVSLKDIIETKHGEKQIIKFHGDFSNPEKIVFTRKDYDKRLKIEDDPLDILFRSHILGKSVLFLGYGFGDENIKYIFKKHTELYELENLPKSYIISFDDNPEKEQFLRNHNVITLRLDSVTQFANLITEINSEVFKVSVDNEMNAFFKPFPSVMFSSFDLVNLREFVDSSNYTNNEKYNKIRSSLEGKLFPQDIDDDMYAFFETVLSGNYDNSVKEAILLANNHIRFNNPGNTIKLCFDFLSLTDNPYFLIDFRGGSNWIDALMSFEQLLSNLYQDSEEISRIGSMMIIGYLEAAKGEKKQLSYNQLDRMLSMLRSFKYEEIDEPKMGFSKENINSLINHYLSMHDSSLRARHEHSFTRVHSLQEIKNSILGNLPKGLL